MYIVISLKIIEVIFGNNLANMSLLYLRSGLQNFQFKTCIIILTCSCEFQNILQLSVNCNNNFLADSQNYDRGLYLEIFAVKCSKL